VAGVASVIKPYNVLAVLWIVTVIRVNKCGRNAYAIDTGFQKCANDITPGTLIDAMYVSRAARQMGAVSFPSAGFIMCNAAQATVHYEWDSAEFSRVVEHLQKIFVHLVLAFGKVMLFAGSTLAIEFAVIKVLHKLERLP
jgi:hypothetical protein